MRSHLVRTQFSLFVLAPTNWAEQFSNGSFPHRGSSWSNVITYSGLFIFYSRLFPGTEFSRRYWIDLLICIFYHSLKCLYYLILSDLGRLEGYFIVQCVKDLQKTDSLQHWNQNNNLEMNWLIADLDNCFITLLSLLGILILTRYIIKFYPESDHFLFDQLHLFMKYHFETYKTWFVKTRST